MAAPRPALALLKENWTRQAVRGSQAAKHQGLPAKSLFPAQRQAPQPRGQGPRAQGLPSPRFLGQGSPFQPRPGQGAPDLRKGPEPRVPRPRPRKAGWPSPAPKGPRAKAAVPSMKNVLLILESMVLRTPPFYTRSVRKAQEAPKRRQSHQKASKASKAP